MRDLYLILISARASKFLSIPVDGVLFIIFMANLMANWIIHVRIIWTQAQASPPCFPLYLLSAPFYLFVFLSLNGLDHRLFFGKLAS